MYPSLIHTHTVIDYTHSIHHFYYCRMSILNVLCRPSMHHLTPLSISTLISTPSSRLSSSAACLSSTADTTLEAPARLLLAPDSSPNAHTDHKRECSGHLAIRVVAKAAAAKDLALRPFGRLLEAFVVAWTAFHHAQSRQPLDKFRYILVVATLNIAQPVFLVPAHSSGVLA